MVKILTKLLALLRSIFGCSPSSVFEVSGDYPILHKQTLYIPEKPVETKRIERDGDIYVLRYGFWYFIFWEGNDSSLELCVGSEDILKWNLPDITPYLQMGGNGEVEALSKSLNSWYWLKDCVSDRSCCEIDNTSSAKLMMLQCEQQATIDRQRMELMLLQSMRDTTQTERMVPLPYYTRLGINYEVLNHTVPPVSIMYPWCGE